MTKTLKIELDGVKVDIDLENHIEKEVEKRLKKLKPKEVIKEVRPYTRTVHGRAQGNTYRLLLEAQLIASGNPETNVIVVSHNYDYARDLYRRAMEMAYPNTDRTQRAKDRIISYNNGSTIRFVSYEHLDNHPSYTFALKNPCILYDAAVFDLAKPRLCFI